MQYNIEFPEFKENNNEKEIVDLINKITDTINSCRVKIFIYQEEKLKKYIGLLIDIKNKKLDLNFDDIKNEILKEIKDVENEYQKQIKLDELYEDDHLDQYHG